MEVLVADKKGFCFGVEHAIAMARRMLEEGKKVYCLGSLIHNKQVVDRLAGQGLIVVERVEEIPWGEQLKNKNEKLKIEDSPAAREFKQNGLRAHPTIEPVTVSPSEATPGMKPGASERDARLDDEGKTPDVKPGGGKSMATLRLGHATQTGATGEPPTVLIRSHGCRPELIEQVKARGLRLADATCILVKRVQKLIRTLHEQGYRVVIVGDPEHPEVAGTVGYAPGVIVIKDEGDLDSLPERGKVAVVSQTTYSAEDFGKIVGLIAMRNYDEIKIVNTICRETSLRQASAVELCRQVDVMFVLGSHHSANTGELAHLCRRQGVQTYHLQNWDEFKPEYVAGRKVAGVTAGASTPDWIIEEFVSNLQKLTL